MTRGDVYLLHKPNGADPRRRRAVVVVSRQVLIDSQYDSVVCAPVYSKYLGLESQVEVGAEVGLKHESAIHCDGLVSVAKARLTDVVGTLDNHKLEELNYALGVALGLC